MGVLKREGGVLGGGWGRVLKGEGGCSEGKGGSSKGRGGRRSSRGKEGVWWGRAGAGGPSRPESLLAEEVVGRRPRREGQGGRRILLRADHRPRGLPPLPLRAAT